MAAGVTLPKEGSSPAYADGGPCDRTLATIGEMRKSDPASAKAYVTDGMPPAQAWRTRGMGLPITCRPLG